MTNLHGDMEPIEDWCRREGKSLPNTECIVRAVRHDAQLGRFVARSRPHQSRHPLSCARCLTPYPRKDIGSCAGGRKPSRENFKVSQFALADTSDESAVDRNRPIGPCVCGSGSVDRGRDTVNPLAYA